MKLDVPYYSQYLDAPDLYWAPRACGFCCVKMVLDFYKIEAPSIIELAKEADTKGGYGKSGLKHDYVVNLFSSCGLNTRREEKMNEKEGIKEGIEKIYSSLKDNNPVIVSVFDEILGQKRFHQVVLTGFETDSGGLKGFYFNDPRSLYREEGEGAFVSLLDFIRDWRHMAIFVSK